MARERDRSRLVYGGLRDVNVDLGATSIVASAADEAMLDGFGVLGRCCFLRRPDVSPIPGTIFITPAERGALPLALCLPEEDLRAMNGQGKECPPTRNLDVDSRHPEEHQEGKEG